VKAAQAAAEEKPAVKTEPNKGEQLSLF